MNKDKSQFLNELCNKIGLNAPENSVHCMALFRAHKPTTRKELENLIAKHKNKCVDCEIKSKGSIQDFANTLFKAQENGQLAKEFAKLGMHRCTEQECFDWIYDLYITKTFIGAKAETKAIEELNKQFQMFTYKPASLDEDSKYAVDIIVSLNNKTIAGIQVKSKYYKKSKNIDDTKANNQTKNEAFNVPVFYFYYTKHDNNNVSFSDAEIDKLIKELNKLYLSSSHSILCN